MSSEIIDWENFYQIGKTGWDRGLSSNNLDYWINNGLLKPCRILIPGCGNGYEVLKLAELGFEWLQSTSLLPQSITYQKL